MTQSRSIAQAAAVAGVSTHAVRYYEAEGMIPPVPRDRSGRRVFDEDAVAWIEYAACLRGLGMPVRAIADYVAVAATGDHRERRLEAMQAHLDTLKAKRRDLDAYIAAIEAKIRGLQVGLWTP